MRKWVFKISKHTLRLMLRTIEVLFAVVIIFVSLAFWRLSVEPLNVDFLAPKLIERFVPKEAGIIVDVRSVELGARAEEDGLFHLQIKDLSVLKPDGAVITDLPKIEMSYGLWRVLTLNYMPDTLTITDPLLQMTIDKDGKFYLQNKKPETAVSAPLEDTAEHAAQTGDEKTAEGADSKQDSSPFLIADANGIVHYLMAFKKLELENAQLILDNRQHQRQYSVPSLNLLLERANAKEYILEADALVAADDSKNTHLVLKALLNRHTRDISFEMNFDSLYLPRLGKYIPVLEDAKLKLKGVVLGHLNLSKGKNDIRKAVRELSFKIQNEKPGTVNLPAPLTNLYTVKTMLIQGAFAPGLETLKIDQSALTTGDKTTASLAVDVTGLGAFLDTGNLGSIKTVLKSTVKNVPTEEVPNLWPSALGPDAHAWVKANLSKGSISTADFTLYFTGDNLDDLFGDIKASGVTVRYIEQMPSVQGVAATVHLYPDKVEIFADKGSLDGIVLKKADLYLTELKDDVSHAKVVLQATGPVADVMKLIDSKPLEFAKEFGIAPDKTGGTGDVGATLSFPLIEDLDANQITADVTAQIQNGVFPTPIRDVSVQNGTFDLRVNNTRLNLQGNAQMQGLPLKLSWDEYFKQTKENVTKSHYFIEGTVTQTDLLKWVPSVDDYLTGTMPFAVTVKNDFKGMSDIKAAINLTGAQVKLYPISATKETGEKADLNIAATFDAKKLPSKFAFDFNAPDSPIVVKGNLDTTNGIALVLDKVEAPGTSFSGRYVSKGLDKEVVLKGKAWNLTQLFEMPAFKSEEKKKARAEDKPQIYRASYQPPSNISVDIDLESAMLVDKKPLRRVQLKGFRSGAYWRSLDGLLRASDDFVLTYIPQTGQLRGETNNLGDLLSRLGLSSRFFGGQLRLSATQNAQGVFKGDVNVRSFSLRDPGFLIQAFTVLGIVDGIRGKDLSFARAHVPFEFNVHNVLDIGEGYANGTTIGVTFKGKVSVPEVDLSGSVIPAYAINSLPGKIPLIGTLFKGSAGGGLMGVRYEVKGTLFKPVTTFNALSSIAPGILGNLFGN